MRMNRLAVLACSTVLGLSGTAALAAGCPAVTVADMQGLEPAYPEQFELDAFQAAAGCTLGFAANPGSAALNARILGNPALPPLAERLPAEPLVVAPYETIGSYGGVINGVSRATESGTSDMLSVRHVNLVRYADDLKTIVPNVAKSWDWNADFTQLTFTLRKGHKWSDGAPFTADDIVFWYNDLLLNPAVTAKVPDRWLFDGKPATVEALDAEHVRFTFPTPQPNLLNRWAVDYGQTFQPRHWLARFMDKYNPDAAALRAEYGFATEGDAVNFYYGNSDWKDVPSAMMKDPALAARIGKNAVPTLESHIVVEESAEGRRLVANPYFHMVDTAGNQLPYIPEIHEAFVPEREVVNLRILNGDVTWKEQALELNDFPLLKENEAKGHYKAVLAPTFGENVFYSFNRNDKDPVLRAIFSDPRFSQALSLGMDREEIREIVYLGQGNIQQALPAETRTVDFITEADKTAFTAFDPETANRLLDEIGLKTGPDGLRLRPDGAPLTLRLVFASQGSPVQLHELVRGQWAKLGLQVDIREVTTDEYRASANNNDVDVFIWKNDGITGPFISQDATMLMPPFGDFFNPGGGFDWVKWHETNGAEGSAPPADIARLWPLGAEFVSQPLGSARSNEIGAEIIRIHLDNLLKIGVVADIPSPYVYDARLANFRPQTAKTYDFYWTYSYRPQQWFFRD